MEGGGGAVRVGMGRGVTGRGRVAVGVGVRVRARMAARVAMRVGLRSKRGVARVAWVVGRAVGVRERREVGVRWGQRVGVGVGATERRGGVVAMRGREWMAWMRRLMNWGIYWQHNKWVGGMVAGVTAAVVVMVGVIRGVGT